MSDHYKKLLLLFLICSILITLSVLSMYLFFLKYKKNQNTVTDYQSCIKDPESIILESYPARCVTKNKETFIQPLSKEEQDQLKPPHSATGTNGFELISEGKDAPITVQEQTTIIQTYQEAKKWLQENQLSNLNLLTVPVNSYKNHTYIALFEGKKPTGGYDIQVSKIKETNNEVIVQVIRSELSSICLATQLVSSPYQIIRINKTAKPIRFEFTQRVQPC